MAQRWGLSIEELRGAAEGAVHRVEPWAAGSLLAGRGAPYLQSWLLPM